MKRHMNKNGKTKASMLKGSNKDSYNNTWKVFRIQCMPNWFKLYLTWFIIRSGFKDSPFYLPPKKVYLGYGQI